MAFEDFLLLMTLAEEAKIDKVRLSTSFLASRFNISQQSASRKLREFEKLGLITRTATPYGTDVSLTEEGKSFLRQVNSTTKNILYSKQKNYLQGTVSSGLGEGSYYTSLKQYKEQFKEKLGFVPFTGTLNLKVTLKSLKTILGNRLPLTIKGFSTPKRTFGKIKCFPVLVENKTKAAIVFPERSNNPEATIELIAPINLRKEFSLKDNSKLKITIE